MLVVAEAFVTRALPPLPATQITLQYAGETTVQVRVCVICGVEEGWFACLSSMLLLVLLRLSYEIVIPRFSLDRVHSNDEQACSDLTASDCGGKGWLAGEKTSGAYA